MKNSHFEKNPILCYAVTSRWSANFGSQWFWSDKRKVWISDTPYYTWCQDASHTKRADRKTIGLLKTDKQPDY